MENGCAPPFIVACSVKKQSLTVRLHLHDVDWRDGVRHLPLDHPDAQTPHELVKVLAGGHAVPAEDGV